VKTPVDPDVEPYAETDGTYVAGDDGTAEVTVEVTEGDDALMVINERTGAGYVNVVSLTDPDGTVVLFDEDTWSDDDRLTHATFLTDHANTLNWPIREEDGPLAPGTWTVRVGLWTEDDEPEPGAEVRVRTVVRATPDELVLPVWIAYAGRILSDEHLGIEAATNTAVERWKEIYASVGITLDVHTTAADTSYFLGPASETDWVELYDTLDPRGVLVVIGAIIEDPAFDTFVNGECPSNPGPFVSTPISGVEIAGAVLAGDDGAFDDTELDTYATTLAHEVGHYLGLFHAVQLVDHSDDPPSAWDALDDTEHCRTYDACVEALGDNVMFPFPICDDADVCTSGSVFTEEQGAVLRGWVGVRAQ
jgi:hypothetical protein